MSPHKVQVPSNFTSISTWQFYYFRIITQNTILHSTSDLTEHELMNNDRNSF